MLAQSTEPVASRQRQQHLQETMPQKTDRFLAGTFSKTTSMAVEMPLPTPFIGRS
jgi:hypothetical protein